MQPALGRAFAADEDQPGRGDVVIVSHGTWQRRFGADPALAGKSLNLNGRPFKVVGIMPATFQPLPVKSEIWTPLVFSPADAANRGSRYLSLLARLNPENVSTMEIALPRTKYPDGQQQAVMFRRVLERVAALPGVESAGVINDLPLASGGSSTNFVVKGVPTPAQGQEPRTQYRPVSSDYFRAMGIPLVRGRSVSERDTPPVVVISENIARRLFPNEDPVGKSLGIDSPPEWREIVGVVGDVRHHRLDNEAKPEIYVPFQQNAAEYLTLTSATMSLVVRTSAEPTALADAARCEVLAVDNEQPVSKVKTMRQVVDGGGVTGRGGTPSAGRSGRPA